MFIGQVSGPAKTCENLLPLSDFSRISSISWDTKHKGWIPSLEVVDEKAARMKRKWTEGWQGSIQQNV